MFGPTKRLKALSEKAEKAYKEAKAKEEDCPIEDGPATTSEKDANAAVDAAEAVVKVAKRAVLAAIADKRGRTKR